MEEPWFSEVPDELARCLVDAESCAEACERLLADVRTLEDGAVRQRLVTALVAPAAVARVLIELIEPPQDLVLAACRLYRESAQTAIEALEEARTGLDDEAAITALRASAASCQLLIDAASTS